jgi:hypothetical protein
LRGFAISHAVALGAVAVSAAAAESETVRWGELQICYAAYDWEASPSDRGDAITFVCVAAACTGRPIVIATAAPVSDADTEMPPRRDDATPMPLPAGSSAAALGFFADSLWSGCRAVDLPILEATLTRGGIAYRMTTAIVDGCQRGPEVPEDVFLDLVAGIGKAGGG